MRRKEISSINLSHNVFRFDLGIVVLSVLQAYFLKSLLCDGPRRNVALSRVFRDHGSLLQQSMTKTNHYRPQSHSRCILFTRIVNGRVNALVHSVKLLRAAADKQPLCRKVFTVYFKTQTNMG